MAGRDAVGFLKEPVALNQGAAQTPAGTDAGPEIVRFTPVAGFEEIIGMPSSDSTQRTQKVKELMGEVAKQNVPWIDSAFGKIHREYPWVDTLMVDPYGRTVIVADGQRIYFKGFWGAPVQYDDVRRPPTSEELLTLIKQLGEPAFLLTHPLDAQLYVFHDDFPELRRSFEKALRAKKHGRVPFKVRGVGEEERKDAILNELRTIETEIDDMPFKPERFAVINEGGSYRQVDVVRVNSGALGDLQQTGFVIGKIVLKDIGQKVREGLGFRPAGGQPGDKYVTVGYYARAYIGDHPSMPKMNTPDKVERRQPVYITPMSEADELLSGKVPTSTGEMAYVVHATPRSNLAVDTLLAYAGDGMLNGTPLVLTHTVDRRWINR